jgi:hypothetical protein
MTPVVARLTEVDPMSESARKLKAAAFQLQGLNDSTLAVLEALETMPFDLTVTTFVPAGSGYDVQGLILNRQEVADTTPPITFEFLNEAGEVVQALTVEPQPVEASGGTRFTLAPVGEGIVAWRYRTES